jgi:PAS domain S-box-containing protein
LEEIDVIESPEDIDRHHEIILKNGFNIFEAKHRTKNGEIRDIMVKLRAIHLGKKVFNLAVWQDITEQKRSEQALKESEEKYRAIFEQAVDSIGLIDMETGEMRDFNNKACDGLGYTREEFAKIKIQDIDPTLSTDNPSSGNTIPMENEQRVFESKHRTKSGELRDVRVSTTFIHLRERLVGMCIWQDITEQKRAKERLRESEEKYRAIFEQSTDSIALINTDTAQFVTFNTNTYKNLGYTRNEFAKLHSYDIDAAETRVDAENRKNEIIKNEGIHSFETKHKTKNGEIRDVQVGIRFINFSGNNYILAIWQDITDRKKAEEKLRETLINLERFNRLAVGREHRMIELKREINDLMLSSGRQEKYRIPTLETVKK